MKKLLLIGIGSVLLAACSNENDMNDGGTQTGDEQPLITGEIIEIQDGRFLVESDSSAPDKDSYDLVWFSAQEIGALKVGQTVSVWADEVRESYPAQADADKIEIKD